MNIPTEMYYLIGGGVTYLILKDVFKFIKYGIETLRAKASANPVVVKDKGDREVLELILRKTETTGKCLSDLKLEFVEYKTKFCFLSEAVKEQNGSVKEATGKITQLLQNFATRFVVCDGRFKALEKDKGGE